MATFKDFDFETLHAPKITAPKKISKNIRNELEKSNFFMVFNPNIANWKYAEPKFVDDLREECEEFFTKTFPRALDSYEACKYFYDDQKDDMEKNKLRSVRLVSYTAGPESGDNKRKFHINIDAKFDGKKILSLPYLRKLLSKHFARFMDNPNGFHFNVKNYIDNKNIVDKYMNKQYKAGIVITKPTKSKKNNA